jgi:hypothetical protein
VHVRHLQVADDIAGDKAGLERVGVELAAIIHAAAEPQAVAG